MYVITADQVDSRHRDDLATDALRAISTEAGDRLVLPPDRTAGDEVQAVTDDAEAALDLVLRLSRHGDWSVGLGIGEVRQPLPEITRAATGPAFVAARDAVEAAKRRPTRFAARIDPARALTAEDLEPLIDLLLQQRARRSEEGWELHDLLRGGMTQTDAARRLGVTPQAVSQRAQAAMLRVEDAARTALVRLLRDADADAGAPITVRKDSPE